MQMLIRSVLLLLCTCYVSSQTDRPIITTPQGQVQGVTLTNNNGRTYYGFRGIPFAQPPVGERRFVKPEQADAWSGVLDASVEASECYQVNDTTGAGEGSEDCLYINVYSPELPDTGSESKAVMVWIYGGAFEIGSSAESMYGSGKLMGYDVISVTFNYRLSAFGFLSTGDEVIPGNYGLWDQILALQWVQENIAAFGGDPERVTIYGQSAGSWSTSSLFLSPQANGLFHGVISQSGTQMLPWSYQPNPLPYAQTMAEYLNCPTDNSSLMLPCLQGKSAEDIYEAGSYAGAELGGDDFYFLPVIDSQVSDGVLPQEPIDLIRNSLYNKVPYINGLTENEGGYFFEINEENYGAVYDGDFITNNLSTLVGPYTLLTGDELTEVTSLVYDLYFNDIDLDNETAIGEGVQAFISDSLFNTAHFLMMNLLPKGENYPAIYSYVFAYHGEYMLAPDTGMTTHGDELPYIFDEEVDNNGILNAQDNVTSERLLTLWTTFAKSGDPNPTNRSDLISVTWDPVTSDSVQYLNIGSELSMEEDFRSDRMEFWNSSIVPIVIPNY